MSGRRSIDTTGFDPTVVAQFFATLNEFRSSLERLSGNFEKLGNKLDAVQKELSISNAQAAKHQEQISDLSRRVDRREIDARDQRELVQSLQTEISCINAKGEGIGIMWKILIGMATFSGIGAGLLTAFRNI